MPSSFDIPVLFQNDDIIVIHKPAGLPVHAGSGGGENLEDYLHQFQSDKKHPPYLAHRLDRDTSGCLILGRTKESIRKLGRMFETKRIHKTYWAIVHGEFPFKQGRIDMPLAKINDQKNKWHMRVDPEGQQAVTDIRVLGVKDGISWLELKPRTGRTHQIRVHCAAHQCPIIGDRFYGDNDQTPHLMLHARALSIPSLQPGVTEPIYVEAPAPDYMTALIDRIRAPQ